MRMAPCTSLAQLVAVVALATPALGLLDWNQMTVRQQVQTLITPGAATTAAPPAPRQPQAVESASAVLARDQKPGSTVIESSCRHGENDRSAITGTINCACYWHEPTQTGNPHLRGHPTLGPTTGPHPYFTGCALQDVTSPTPSPTPPTPAPTPKFVPAWLSGNDPARAMRDFVAPLWSNRPDHRPKDLTKHDPTGTYSNMLLETHGIEAFRA